MNSKLAAFFGILFPLYLMLFIQSIWLQSLIPWWETLGWSLVSSTLALWTLSRYYHHSKPQEAAMLRFLILLFAAAYLIHKFFVERPGPRDFRSLPLDLKIWLGIILVSWSLTQSSGRPWLFRNFFHGMLKNKDVKTIKEKLRGLGFYLKKTLSIMRRLKNRILWILWFTVLLMGFIIPLGETVFIGLVISWGFATLILLASLFLIQRALREDFLLGEGIISQGRPQPGEGLYYLLLLAIITLTGLLASIGKAILPTQLIKKALDTMVNWFGRWQPISDDSLNRISEDSSNLPGYPSIMQIPPPPDQGPPRTPMSQELKQLLMIIAVSTVTLLFIWFMVQPLFKGNKEKKQLKKPIQRGNWLKRLKLWFSEWFSPKKKGQVLTVEWDNISGSIKSSKK
ncbi:MAG: hypothetical protein PF447_11410 [Spirochaetaceae bacterium]|nr:hypothetical protein [Spirochaetaceae bacterium]